ncbi:MAG: hypothetical protein J7484_13420 [Microbacterium sp.]|nr:hypothetical protein [Microbacterium sp.]
MTTTTPPVPGPHARIPDRETAVAFVHALLRGAARRQLWLFPLDADDRTTDLVIPMTIPRHPDREAGWGLARLLLDLGREHQVASWVVVLERPGTHSLARADLAWFEAVAVAVRLSEVELRALVHVTTRTTQGVTPRWRDEPRLDAA